MLLKTIHQIVFRDVTILGTEKFEGFSVPQTAPGAVRNRDTEVPAITPGHGLHLIGYVALSVSLGV